MLKSVKEALGKPRVITDTAEAIAFLEQLGKDTGKDYSHEISAIRDGGYDNVHLKISPWGVEMVGAKLAFAEDGGNGEEALGDLLKQLRKATMPRRTLANTLANRFIAAGAELLGYVRNPSKVTPVFDEVMSLLNELGERVAADGVASRRYVNLNDRLAEYSVDLDDIEARLYAFMDGPDIVKANKLAEDLGRATPALRRVVMDVYSDMDARRKEQKEELADMANI